LGEGRLNNAISGIGGEEKFIEALCEGNVSLLSSVEGISQKMAVDMILVHRGVEKGDMLRTDAARQIFTSIMDVLRSYMHTEVSRNKASLLVPGGNILEMVEKCNDIHSYSEMLEGKDREKIEGLLKNISVKGTSKGSKITYPYILIVEDEEAYDQVRRRGLDNRCLVLSPDEIGSGMEQDTILVYSKREIDEEMLPIVASVGCSALDHEIIPETALEEFLPIIGRIRAVSELRSIFGERSISKRAVEIVEELSHLSNDNRDPEVIRERIEVIRSEVEQSLKEAISDLTLSGDDTLSLLASGEIDPLKKIYHEHARMAAELVKQRIGVKKDLFLMKYPLEVDAEGLEEMIRGMKERAAGDRFRKKVELAAEIENMKDEVRKEMDWALDIDWKFGLGCFVNDLGLNPFEISSGFMAVKGAADIHLRMDGQYQAVDYHMGPMPGELGEEFHDIDVSDSRTAMLTGANSGGKTTLLMTIAQTVIMAKMGLPVPAEKAYIPDISKLFIYKPKRRLDAGGLESFLKELLPLSMKVDETSLVLADELEAMTELEAAARIIGVFLEELSCRDAYSVVVTHMADEIGKFTECRVDGIEARGLDEKHNLIVDRTPVIGLHAKSTPELILRKLEARSKGDEKKVYSRVLKSFE
jgi:hypothetical protein